MIAPPNRPFTTIMTTPNMVSRAISGFSDLVIITVTIMRTSSPITESVNIRVP